MAGTTRPTTEGQAHAPIQKAGAVRPPRGLISYLGQPR
jgi:hypothetical protein